MSRRRNDFRPFTITVEDIDITLTRKIGTGLHGSVYDGVSDGRIFAVKIFSDENLDTDSDEEVENLYNNELWFIQHLNELNPSIVPKYYAAEPTVIVYENIDGPDLTRMSINDKIAIGNRAFVDLVQTVDWMHQNDIYHGDINSGNIMYDGSNRDFKFIDWALGFTPSEDSTEQDLIITRKNDLAEITNVLFEFYSGYYLPHASGDLDFIEQEYTDVDPRIKEILASTSERENFIDIWTDMVNLADELDRELVDAE